MKKMVCFVLLPASLLISGCASVPPVPQQLPGKYALQVLRVDVPGEPIPTYKLTSRDVSRLWRCPTADISEFPVVYAGVGETAVSDQTTPYHSPESYEVVHDDAGNLKVIYSDEVAKLGQRVEFTVDQINKESVSYRVKTGETELQGMRQYQIRDPEGSLAYAPVYLPILGKTEFDTQITQEPGTWVGIGGPISEKTINVDSESMIKTQLNRILLIRVFPPAKEK